uniref:Uncharacterized protein n=1 Tax=Oryza barthii TaxID=65489 RepID=A0A0D3EJ63_9ORYZ
MDGSWIDEMVCLVVPLMTDRSGCIQAKEGCMDGHLQPTGYYKLVHAQMTATRYIYAVIHPTNLYCTYYIRVHAIKDTVLA